MDAEPEPRRAAAPQEIDSVQAFDAYLKSLKADEIVLIQYTAPWCRRCATLKTEVSAAYDDSLRWICVDVSEMETIQLRYNVTVMPRLDVYRGGKSDTAEGFDATLDNLAKMLEAASTAPPQLSLADDF